MTPPQTFCRGPLITCQARSLMGRVLFLPHSQRRKDQEETAEVTRQEAASSGSTSPKQWDHTHGSAPGPPPPVAESRGTVTCGTLCSTLCSQGL